LDKVSNFFDETLIFADFLLNVDFSSHVAWSVFCPRGRIEEGKPPEPFVLPYSLPSIFPLGLDFVPAPRKLIGMFSLKNRQKSAYH
jgi:hypothetical protein